MKNIFINKKVQTTVEIAVSLFGLFMIYQILRRMFGGSWGMEEVIFGLVVLHIGFTFGLAMKTAETRTDLKHLNKQFYALATDFKALREQTTAIEHKIDLSLKKRK